VFQCDSVLQCVAVCCSVFVPPNGWCIVVFTVCCSILQYSAECVAVFSSMLQCMLQKVLATQEVVCCSVLQCLAL